MQSRRLFLGTLGVAFIRVPRSQNPFAVARKIERYLNKNDDLRAIRSILKRPALIPPSDSVIDVPEHDMGNADVGAAE
jgi:hypothetical protein